MPREHIPPHPRREPEVTGALTVENLQRAFGGSADLTVRRVKLAAGRGGTVTVCAVEGLVSTGRLNDNILRPLERDRELAGLDSMACLKRLEGGGIPLLAVRRVKSADEGVFALLGGSAVMAFEGLELGLACGVDTEEKRSISDAEEEPDPKGGKDGFVESLRTNTGLLRRRLHSAGVRVWEETVGRQSRTAVDVVYLEGIADGETVKRVKERLRGMDIDGVTDAGHLEQYLCDKLESPFPQLLATRRPDRVCAELLQGRVAVLADGIPLGFLLPATAELFLSSAQDRTAHWTMALALKGLRYGALLVTLFLPAVYVAAVLFHPEMIPLELAESIIAAREDVPFGTLFEAVVLLVAFEVLQEAGLRLPGNLGQTVGILGGLVVGSAAVEAKILSPAVLIVVAAAGIAGYTIPSQDFAGAIRLWRLGLTLCAGAAGLLGVGLGTAVLVGHLAGLSSFGVPFLSHARRGNEAGIPFPWFQLRPRGLNSENRRNQG